MESEINSEGLENSPDGLVITPLLSNVASVSHTLLTPLFLHLQGNDDLPSVEESRELPVIEETAAQDENTKDDDEKRTLGKKKPSFGDVSLELAKLHVSFLGLVIHKIVHI